MFLDSRNEKMEVIESSTDIDIWSADLPSNGRRHQVLPFLNKVRLNLQPTRKAMYAMQLRCS